MYNKSMYIRTNREHTQITFQCTQWGESAALTMVEEFVRLVLKEYAPQEALSTEIDTPHKSDTLYGIVFPRAPGGMYTMYFLFVQGSQLEYNDWDLDTQFGRLTVFSYFPYPFPSAPPAPFPNGLENSVESVVQKVFSTLVRKIYDQVH